MSYKLNKKLVNLVPYDPITGHYDIRLDVDKTNNVYNLQGQKVLRHSSNIEQLPKGVYVIKGKKIIKK